MQRGTLWAVRCLPSVRGAVASAPGCQRRQPAFLVPVPARGLSASPWGPLPLPDYLSAPEKLGGFSTPFQNSGLRWSELGRAELLLAGRNNFLTS